MAIYHLSAQVISRGKGRSVVAAAAYRSATKILDEQYGELRDYSKKPGVEYTEILAPEDAPEWAQDRAKLWNEVEDAENRKDAQLAREMRVALPTELTNTQQVEMVREYVQEQFVNKGMVADIAIHRDNPENPHAHIMLTLREIGPDGFGKKQRDWNNKENLFEWRSEWAQHANRALERAGQDIRIDHRSYKDQGLAVEPTRHVGTTPEKVALEGRELIREKLAEHDRIVRRNGEAIKETPEIALQAITHQRATFTEQDVGRWLHTRTADAEQFQACLDRVMASPELLSLGKDQRGNERFTTHEMAEVERRMIDVAEGMAQNPGHKVAQKYVRQAESSYTLSEDQQSAFEHVLKQGNLAVVEGFAGTGKSYMLAAAREAWEGQGYQVCGAALAGKAAEGLEISSGIASRSLHSWEYAWKNGHDELTSKHVLVIDEAGMVGSRQMARVLEQAHLARAKVVLVGDTEQLQAIEAGAPLRGISERVGQVTLSDIRRQELGWQREAVAQLARGETPEALQAFEHGKCVFAHERERDAGQSVVRAWARDREANPEQSQIMLAYRRSDVEKLNYAARSYRQDFWGELKEEHQIQTVRGPRNFAEGDRIYFLKNDRGLEVKNGTLGTVEKIGGSNLAVRLDDGRRLAFDTREYNHLDHGYAATVHKAQGVTVDRSYVLASNYFDRHVTYVALSRQREHVELHWSKEQFRSRGELEHDLSRERRKDLVVDYAEAHHLNRDLASELAEKHLQKENDGLSRNYYERRSPEDIRKAYVEHERWADKKPVNAEQMLESFREVEKFVAIRNQHAAQCRRLDADVDLFKREHPVKAKLIEKGLSSADDGLFNASRREHAALANAERELQAVLSSKELRSRAEEMAYQHNKSIKVAQEELPRLRPFYERAERHLEQELKEQAREIERQQKQHAKDDLHRGRYHGHEIGR